MRIAGTLLLCLVAVRACGEAFNCQVQSATNGSVCFSFEGNEVEAGAEVAVACLDGPRVAVVSSVTFHRISQLCESKAKQLSDLQISSFELSYGLDPGQSLPLLSADIVWEEDGVWKEHDEIASALRAWLVDHRSPDILEAFLPFPYSKLSQSRLFSQIYPLQECCLSDSAKLGVLFRSFLGWSVLFWLVRKTSWTRIRCCCPFNLNFQVSLLPSTLHAWIVGFGSFASLFAAPDSLTVEFYQALQTLQFFSASYLLSSVFWESKKLTSIETQHHVFIAILLLLPGFLSASGCQPWLIWMVNLGLLLELTTPLLNLLKSSTILDRVKNNTAKKLDPVNWDEKLARDFTQREIRFCVSFWLFFVVVRLGLPFWLLRVVGEALSVVSWGEDPLPLEVQILSFYALSWIAACVMQFEFSRRLLGYLTKMQRP